MKRTLSLSLVAILFLFILSTYLFPQENPDVDPLDFISGKAKYYKTFTEYFYKQDEFPEAAKIKKEDKKSAKVYFRVFFNDRKKPTTVGYYSTKDDDDSPYALKKLSQYVNRDKIAYYIIKYDYRKENEDLIQTKYFKDLKGRIVASYNYSWDPKTNKLIKIERYGKTLYLNQMELKSYSEFKWKGDKLIYMIYYDKNRLPIEKYSFSEKFKLEGPLTSIDAKSIYSVGNNRVFIGYLKRYDRFRLGSNTLKTYYILYKQQGEGLIEEKYNQDAVLLEEKFHREMPKSESNEKK